MKRIGKVCVGEKEREWRGLQAEVMKRKWIQMKDNRQTQTKMEVRTISGGE